MMTASINVTRHSEFPRNGKVTIQVYLCYHLNTFCLFHVWSNLSSSILCLKDALLGGIFIVVTSASVRHSLERSLGHKTDAIAESTEQNDRNAWMTHGAFRNYINGVPIPLRKKIHLFRTPEEYDLVLHA